MLSQLLVTVCNYRKQYAKYTYDLIKDLKK